MRWFLVMLCFLIGTANAAWYFNKEDVLKLHHNPAHHKLVYGTDPLQFGKLRLPQGSGPHPVAIIVHGGCWLSKISNINSTEPLADALRDIGIATWNIEYRQVDNPGGGFPGTFHDVGQAADYLRQISSKYHLDLNRVVVIGHSAGGQLALWLAARHKLAKNEALYKQDPLKLNGVIVLGGVPDLEAAYTPAKQVCGEDVVGHLLGSTHEKTLKRRYKQASPIDLLPLEVPQVLIYGQADQVVPSVIGQKYAAVAKQKGEEVQLLVVPDTAHHEYIVPNTVAWAAMRDALFKLLSLAKKT